eukprot:12022654-Karenia_brevis.AAC.1
MAALKITIWNNFGGGTACSTAHRIRTLRWPRGVRPRESIMAVAQLAATAHTVRTLRCLC